MPEGYRLWSLPEQSFWIQCVGSVAGKQIQKQGYYISFLVLLFYSLAFGVFSLPQIGMLLI